MSDNDVIIERAADTEALLGYIDNHLGEVLTEWATELVKEVAVRNGVQTNEELRQRVLNALRLETLDLRPGFLQDQVLKIITEARREGSWGSVIDAFVEARDLERPRPEERRQLIRALEDLHLDPDDDGPALDHTVSRLYREIVGSSGGSDPIALTSPPGRITPWNFRVRPFDVTAGRQIRAESVLAAGALAWCHEIGERMGVYRLADALVYRWWIGDVDFSDADLVAQLYRYWKLRDERPSEEDRGLLYRRILAVGDTELSDRIVVNESFPVLWRNLMEEISIFLSKTESSFRVDQISRAGVFQSATELQHNLSEHMAGMAVLHVTEMYNQLRAERPEAGNLGALDILEHPEVIAQFAAGSERHVSTVIRRLASDEFGVAPNVGSIATSADQGYAVYEWLADFRPGQVDDASFMRLIEAGKAWILAQQAAGEGLATTHRTADGATGADQDDWDDGGWDDEEWDDGDSAELRAEEAYL